MATQHRSGGENQIALAIGVTARRKTGYVTDNS